MATFEGLDPIGEKVFKYFSAQALLKLQLVCNNWFLILNNPILWLKKLKQLGQPEEVTDQWRNIIAKCKNFNIQREILAKALKRKYFYLISKSYLQTSSYGMLYLDEIKLLEFHLEQPPILTSVKFGLLELVDVLTKIGENFDEKVQTCPTHIEPELPIFEALRSNKDFQVVVYLLTHMKTPINQMRSGEGITFLDLASQKGSLQHLAIKMLGKCNNIWQHVDSNGNSCTSLNMF